MTPPKGAQPIVGSIAEAIGFWRKQNTELLVMRAPHARTPKQLGC
jgi:hypothetical protein